MKPSNSSIMYCQLQLGEVYRISSEFVKTRKLKPGSCYDDRIRYEYLSDLPDKLSNLNQAAKEIEYDTAKADRIYEEMRDSIKYLVGSGSVEETQ